MYSNVPLNLIQNTKYFIPKNELINSPDPTSELYNLIAGVLTNLIYFRDQIQLFLLDFRGVKLEKRNGFILRPMIFLRHIDEKDQNYNTNERITTKLNVARNRISSLNLRVQEEDEKIRLEVIKQKREKKCVEVQKLKDERTDTGVMNMRSFSRFYSYNFNLQFNADNKA
jgi:hypothetical protein